MFEKRKDSSAESSTRNSNNNEASRASSAPTPPFNTRSTAIIGTSITIKGEIKGDENLVIAGKVEGKIELSNHDLTIAQEGDVHANLSAKTVKAEGRVTGDISGSEKVTITKSGRVTGNIVAPRVTLEDGAKFKGSIDMDPEIESPTVSAPPKRAPGSVSPTVVKSDNGKPEDSTGKETSSIG